MGYIIHRMLSELCEGFHRILPELCKIFHRLETSEKSIKSKLQIYQTFHCQKTLGRRNQFHLDLSLFCKWTTDFKIIFVQ